MQHHGPVQLPPELAHVFNHAYFLHLLATDPAKVVPPGKSLLSMIAQSHADPQHNQKDASDLQGRVEKVVHTAFWAEAFQSLSSPLPSVQLPRLKGLYSDLLDALAPLYPPTHSLLQTLSAPLPPTSSPLHSTLVLLQEILVSLRQRCAPVRDATIDTLLRGLDPASSSSALSNSSNTHPASTPGSSEAQTLSLARLIIDTIQSIITIAETMKTDLNQFVYGSMTESQVKEVIIQQAKARERELVVNIWRNPERSAEEVIHSAWRSWVHETKFTNTPADGVNREREWVLRLLQALASAVPVSCDFPSPHLSSEDVQSAKGDVPLTTNNLPPQFFFIAPTLLYIQNFLQALVVAASLRSLTRLPTDFSTSTAGHDFMERVWSLLKAEIDEDDGGPAAGDTKIINLADEVIRAQQLSSGQSLDKDKVSQLRAAVERILRPQDAVFLLLQKRLMTTLEHQLSITPAISTRTLPFRMQTGRESSTNATSGNTEMEPWITIVSPVKGFEDLVLTSNIEEVIRKISRCVEWVEGVWLDLF